MPSGPDAELESWRRREGDTPNPRTNIMDFRGFDSNINLKFKGRNSHVHRGFPRKSESSNLSREIGRSMR